jgi:outer membrane murein-binding lipoprotein Lpp
MQRPVFRTWGALALAVLVLAACKPAARNTASSDPDEVAALRAEVARLREENAQLRLSPAVLAAEVDGAIRAVNEEKAVAAFKQLADTFPVASETVEMRKRVETFLAQRRTQEDEDKKIAALGFKALPITPSVSHDDMVLTLTSLGVARRWVFDSWGDGWRFLDAEKDKKLLVARMNISAKSRDPQLFGIAAYVADGGTLKRLGPLKYRFSRWSSYASFLGTQPDYRNEFSHSWRIPFTAGVPVTEEDLKHKPIYLVVTGEGCHQRVYDRFGQPPVFYTPGECKSLKPSLTADDFKGGALAVLKRLD